MTSQPTDLINTFLLKIYQHTYVFYLVLGLLGLLVYQYFSYDLEARDSFGRTKLYLAAERGDMNKVNQLISKGAEIDARDNCLWTPFMRAAQNGHLEVARSLLNAGADINAIDKDGYDALMATVITQKSDVITFLLEQGIELNTQDKTMGWTALIWAAKDGQQDILDTLVAYGADKSIVDYSGKTAYDWAMEKGHNDLAARLK